MPSSLSSKSAVIGEPFGRWSLTDTKSPPTESKERDTAYLIFKRIFFLIRVRAFQSKRDRFSTASYIFAVISYLPVEHGSPFLSFVIIVKVDLCPTFARLSPGPSALDNMGNT